MPQQCEVCGKKPAMGNMVTHRGKAKYLGGVGRKVTGRTKRTFKPNLQKVRAVVDGEGATLAGTHDAQREGCTRTEG